MVVASKNWENSQWDRPTVFEKHSKCLIKMSLENRDVIVSRLCQTKEANKPNARNVTKWDFWGDF